MIMAEENREKASNLLGVFKKLGLKLDVSSFEKRLRTQKIVYMLQLHPDFRSYLGYYYNLFIHGPYSPALAFIYYNIPKNTTPAEVKISSEALEYAMKVVSWDNAFLEIASTLIETIKINRGQIMDEELIEHVHGIKPYYNIDEISAALETVKMLKDKYNLNF